MARATSANLWVSKDYAKGLLALSISYGSDCFNYQDLDNFCNKWNTPASFTFTPQIMFKLFE